MPFEEVLGQTYAVRVLQSALKENRLASSYLFFGPPGCGKKTAALALAQALFCQVKPRAGCGECATCRRLKEGKHPDLIRFTPQGQTFKVDQAREIVREASLKPYESSGRFFLLDQVEQLNDSAGNALLKVLEEPPSGLVFVLVSTSPSRVLPTILSRCQGVRFSPLPEDALDKLIENQAKVSAPKAREAGRLAGGDLKRALVLLSEEGALLKAQAEGFLAAYTSSSWLDKLAWAYGAPDSRQDFQEILDLVGMMLRELWVRRESLPERARLLTEPPLHGKSLSGPALLALWEATLKARRAIERNANLPLVLETLVLSERGVS
jgi:DNA polymerase III subunit delta'